MAVRNFDSDGALARNRSDDADSEGAQAQSDVVFKRLDFTDSDSRLGNDFVQRHRRPDSRLDLGDFDFVVAQRVDNALFVGLEFFLVNFGRRLAVVVQKLKGRELVARKVAARIVGVEVRSLRCRGEGSGGQYDFGFRNRVHLEVKVVRRTDERGLGKVFGFVPRSNVNRGLGGDGRNRHHRCTVHQIHHVGRFVGQEFFVCDDQRFRPRIHRDGIDGTKGSRTCRQTLAQLLRAQLKHPHHVDRGG